MRDRTITSLNLALDCNNDAIACVGFAQRFYRSAKPAPTETEYDRRIDAGDSDQSRAVEHLQQSNGLIQIAISDHTQAVKARKTAYPNEPKGPAAYSHGKARAR